MLGENDLLRLVDSGRAETIKKIIAAQLPVLLRLLGSSAFPSDFLTAVAQRGMSCFSSIYLNKICSLTSINSNPLGRFLHTFT
jgi:hypothetical protein